MAYRAEILADSVNPDGVRLTTFRVTFPRFLLAEFNTHRMISKNSASSRAIPPEKSIEQVLVDPFVPEVFGARVKGMGQGEEVSDPEAARQAWLHARLEAVESARNLLDLGVNKSHVNRLLEPFKWHTVIATGTDWDNFWDLRCPPGLEPDIEFPAQIEFQKTTIAMKRAYLDHGPVRILKAGEWHTPLVTDEEYTKYDQLACAEISAGRCAKVSYETDLDWEDAEQSIDRARALKENRHMSPLEHPARADYGIEYSGNFRGFQQLRKFMVGESGQDPRPRTT